MNSKSILVSKTLWTNILMAIGAMLAYLSGQDYIPPEVVEYIIALAIPIVNIILRFMTKNPVDLSLPKKES